MVKKRVGDFIIDDEAVLVISDGSEESEEHIRVFKKMFGKK